MSINIKFSTCIYKLTFVAIFLAGHICEGRDLPSAGLLDEMPRNCSNQEFCLEKHENYPQEQIDMLLSKKYQLTLASVHEVPRDRDGAGDGSQDDCEKKISYGEIYEIIDEHDNVRVVMQSNLFKQQIRIEQCAKPGRLLVEGGTFNLLSTELEDNDIQCVEKRMEYSFLVLTRDGEGVESVRSKNGIPVCCSCRINDV